MHNQKMRCTNKSGVTGVYRRRGLWQANIRVDGHTIHLGAFEDIGKAAEARRQADRKYGFHRNHGLPPERVLA